MQIAILPALDDNYIYVLHDGGEAAVIDPGVAAPVDACLRAHSLRLTGMLLTHSHTDHTGGVPALRRATGAVLIGPAAAGLQSLDRAVQAGDRVPVPGGTLEVIATPGHLAHHVSYYEASAQALFCGDTLFGAGCGRIMESTAATLWQSLCRLAELPDDTRLYSGHEYTISNLEFAVSLEPCNELVRTRLADAAAAVARGQPTVPSTLGLEKRTNPFLRAGDPELAQAIGLRHATPAAVFAELRHRKDRW
jgi:hydroxyacylglutathione hydrolase